MAETAKGSDHTKCDPKISPEQSIAGRNPKASDKRSISETLLPGYLLDITRLRRDVSQTAQTIDVAWPRFKRSIGSQQVCQTLLDIAACAHSHVITLAQDFYTACGGNLRPHHADFISAIRIYGPRYLKAREVIDRYRRMLSDLSGPEYEVERGPAEPDFPFSPIIRFSNPHMAQISVLPDVYMCFLAPFITEQEHANSLRYFSGVLAHMQDIEGLQSNGSIPDIFLAAFWKPGPERAYFHKDLMRRKGDFMLCLTEIWRIIDTISLSEQRQVSSAEILGIALENYRSYMIEGFKLQHIPTWQIMCITMDPWAVAVGRVNPLDTEFSTDEEKARRHDFADVSHFHHRSSVYRYSYGYIRLQDVLYSSFGRLKTMPEDLHSLADTRPKEGNPYERLEYLGPDTFEEYKADARENSITELSKIANKIWSQDPDRSRIYYII